MFKHCASLFCGVGLLGFSLYAGTAYSHLNAKEDGGAAVYVTGEIAPGTESLVPVGIAEQYPVAQQARIHVLGGGVRGSGMLAELQPDSDGKVSVVVARRTRLSQNEPYTPVSLARLFAPDGTLVAWEEFTDQADLTDFRVLTAENAEAGIWRVSFSGGRSGDVIEFRLPETDIWGIRGEMTLGVTSTTPGISGDAYLWIPPTAEIMMVGIDSGSTNGISLLDTQGQAVAKPEADAARRPGRLVPDEFPEDRVVRLDLPENYRGVISVEGVPGLWCPSPEAALKLQGGMVESEGLWVSGPLQARARAWAVATAVSLDHEPAYDFPAAIPDDLEDLHIHVLGFGKYAPLNNIGWTIRRQNENLDPMSPEFGGDRQPSKPSSDPVGPDNYRPRRGPTNFMPGNLAAAVTFDSPLNPAFEDEELIKRSALASFAIISALQGDDLMRESSLFRSRYPVIHAFFTYPAGVALPYEQLHSYMDDEAREIWKQGLMAIADKMADYQAYQSNQWAHMLRGHLDTYLATGESRFLGYFERQAKAYFGNTFGLDSKFGIHPTGYYLEEYGPDGNYDKLNSFCVASIYYDYKELSGADSDLVELIQDAIERNLRFNSFFWLPQPDGSITGPNALNCRTASYMGSAGYPGNFMTKSTFELAAARFAFTEQPTRGLGIGSTFSFVPNNESWIRSTLEFGLQRGAEGNFNTSSGNWTPYIVRTYSRPSEVEPALLPYQEEKTWNLPGMLVWNKNGLYGMVFSDVEGARRNLNGITGGAPTAFWTPATGTFISSMHPENRPPVSNSLKKSEQITFAAIHGKKADGTFFYSGKERASTTSNEGEDVHEITSLIASPAGTIKWKYDYSGEDTRIGVSFQADEPVEDVFVSLPMFVNLNDAQVKMDSANVAGFSAGNGKVRLTWEDSERVGELHDSVRNDIKRLTIPISGDGEWLWITITPETPSTETITTSLN